MDNDVVKFKDWVCTVELGKYSNGRLAISLVSAVENYEQDLYMGSPIATATVNLPDAQLSDKEICIKNYSENEGMLQSLKNAGFVSEIVRMIPSGFVDVAVVEKTEKLIELENATFKTKKLKP